MAESELSINMPCLGCLTDFRQDPKETVKSFCPECQASLSRHHRRAIEKRVAEFRNEYNKHGGGTN